MTVTRHRLEESVRQAQRDLDELGEQVEAGEIEASTAAELRAGYLEELETATQQLADLGDERSAPEPRSQRRVLVGAVILIAAVASTIGLAASVAQDRADGPLEGVATPGEVGLDSISNEAMEAVLAASRDDPSVADQIPNMEFRLAERYFEEQDYLKAFEHYQEIISNDPPADLFVRSMTRVGWLVWLLNDETDLALQTIDRALEVDPGNPLTLYVKGQILWCGAGDPAGAVPLFREVLAGDDLEPAVVAQVEDDIAIAEAGGACTP